MYWTGLAYGMDPCWVIEDNYVGFGGFHQGQGEIFGVAQRMLFSEEGYCLNWTATNFFCMLEQEVKKK